VSDTPGECVRSPECRARRRRAQPKRTRYAATQSRAMSRCARRSLSAPEHTSSRNRFSRRSFSCAPGRGVAASGNRLRARLTRRRAPAARDGRSRRRVR
jgi:hypothetical protein